MQPFIIDLLSRLKSCEALEPANDDILLAGEIFSHARKREYVSDVYPEINNLTITEDEIKALRDQLLLMLRKGLGQSNAAQLIWALGRLRDASLRDAFIEQLELGFAILRSQKFFLDQALSALEEFESDRVLPAETEISRQVADCINQTVAWLEQNRSKER